jgi:hypothetical protein
MLLHIVELASQDLDALGSGGDICTASSAARMAIVDDISVGIDAEQCACDLRNPQGACCLGNVRGLIKEISA